MGREFVGVCPDVSELRFSFSGDVISDFGECSVKNAPVAMFRELQREMSREFEEKSAEQQDDCSCTGYLS